MNFNMVKPCSNCPFRSDLPATKGWLGYERAKEIAEYAAKDNKTFACHKTTHGATEEESQCAGALVFAEKLGVPNSMFQIAERLRLFNPDKLKFDIPVFYSVEEMAKHHE